MRNLKVVKLEQAIASLESAKEQIMKALGDSDAYQMSADQIDGLIEDIQADIFELEG